MDDDFDFDFDEDAGAHLSSLDDAIVEDTVQCKICKGSWEVCETYEFDGGSICPECVQGEINGLLSVIDRASKELKKVDILTLAYLIGHEWGETAFSRKIITALVNIGNARKILEVESPRTTYTCPKCGAVSHNPGDLANKYCVACHVFEDDPA